MPSLNSFSTRSTLKVAGKDYDFFDLAKLNAPPVARLPFSLKVLLENLLRNEDGAFVKRADIETFTKWDAKAGAQQEIAFRAARVLLQDFTGVPARRGPRGDARRDREARRRSQEDQSAPARRPRHRSLGAGR